VHKIASANEDTLEFVNSVGDRIVIALTDEERRQLERAG
jgi:mannitol-1-phosphate/altronate dehydrogenase